MDNKQKVLVFDCETRPMLAYVWNLKEQFVNMNQIVEDWDVMSWAAKWLDKDEVIHRDRRNNKSDKQLMKDLWPLLNEADILVTQNGISFDSKRLNARFIHHGMKPPKPYRHLDTYRIAKSVAEFTSHSLEYLTDKLCTKYKKLNHGKFPGLSLWKECLKGNNKAWDEMKTYNIHDVLSTEELYNKLKAWAPVTAPKVYTSTEMCRMCGSKTQKRGMTENKKKQRLVCTSPTCGAWDAILIPKEKK